MYKIIPPCVADWGMISIKDFLLLGYKELQNVSIPSQFTRSSRT